MIPKDFVRRLINVITFVDLPIRRKFLLFSIGVLLWFVVITVISITTLLDISAQSNRIVTSIVPRNHIAQKVVRKLQSLHIDALDIMHSFDSKAVSHKYSVSRARFDDIKMFLKALENGGKIHDFSRDKGTLLDTFVVEAAHDDNSPGRYVKELSLLTKEGEKLFDVFVETVLGKLNGTFLEGGSPEDLLTEYVKILDNAQVLSHEFSARTAQLYAQNSKEIRAATLFTSGNILLVIFIATALLALFTVWISRSIANPVNSIIQQIRDLGKGNVDITKKIAVLSKDEIGTLSTEFNELMESVHSMAIFKKVIEEDNSLDVVYSRLGEVFEKKLQLDEHVIFEVEKNQNKMKPVFPLSLSENEMSCNIDILTNSSLCRAKRTGHTISSFAYPGICKQFHTEPGREHICIPMIVGDSTGGVAQFIFDTTAAGSISRDAIEKRIFKAEQYIKESLSVLEAKRLLNTLRESATTDQMTGLYNRRFLQEYTDTLVAGVLRREKNVGLLMCDLDYFKQVNDVYGHDVGDLVLKETANLIKKSVRASDLVIRFGGEEFLVLLIDISEGDGMLIAEKIRKELEETKIKVPDGTLTKTISIGMSEFPADTESFWQAIKFADVALYKAKEGGRNRSLRFTEDMWNEEAF